MAKPSPFSSTWSGIGGLSCVNIETPPFQRFPTLIAKQGSGGSGLGGKLRLERVDTRLERFAAFARSGGHRLDRVEFVAADEVEPADRFLGALARAVARFAGHARERAGGAVHQLDEIGDQGVFALHGA